MKIFIPAIALILLAACDTATPPQNTVQDVAANNMAADEVTEVVDDSASAPSSGPAEEQPKSEQELRDEEVAKRDRGEH